jgi:hypothetical protein
MRFQISIKGGELFEMIGEPVDLPNGLGEVFVVHYNPFVKHDLFDKDGDPYTETDREKFRVSHAPTGFRVAGGDSIVDAIDRAVQKMVEKGELSFRTALERAEKVRHESAAA